MRTYYRASGGADAAVQGLIFWAVLLTSPVWIVGGLGYIAYEQLNKPSAAQQRALDAKAAEQRTIEDARKQVAAWNAAHEKWPALRCEAAATRYAYEVHRAKRYGNDWAARESEKIAAEWRNHGCKP